MVAPRVDEPMFTVKGSSKNPRSTSKLVSATKNQDTIQTFLKYVFDTCEPSKRHFTETVREMFELIRNWCGSGLKLMLVWFDIVKTDGELFQTYHERRLKRATADENHRKDRFRNRQRKPKIQGYV